MKPKTIACELPELAAGETRQRIQVFPGPGEYVHPKSGPFTLTADNLSEFADSLNAREVPLDRDHSFVKGQGSKAAGWFVPGTAKVEDGVVRADVEWTPTAADEIRNREYRYISPEFAFGRVEMDGRRVPEPTVHASTITNRPFFKVMEPIAAEDISDEDREDVVAAFGEDTFDALLTLDEGTVRDVIAAAATRIAFADPGYRKDGKQRYPLTSAEEVTAAWKTVGRRNVAGTYAAEQLSRIKARIKRAAKKFGVTFDADSTAGGDMDWTALAEAAGLTIAADASEEDVLEALKKHAAEHADLKTKLDAAPGDDQMKTLIASAAKGEAAAKELAEMKRNTAIKAAVVDLKIAASEQGTYEGFWAIDPAGTEKLLADMSPRLPAVPTGREATTTAVMGPDGKPVARQAGNGEQTLVADTSPVVVDGVPIPVDEDRAKIHAAAMDLLAKQGKTDPNAEGYEAAYVAACIEASSIVGVEL